MAIQGILSQAGPLPITVNFNALSDGAVILEVNGSIWTMNPNSMIGIQIAIDGSPVGNAQVFSNTPSTHRTVVPAYIPLKLTFGPHSITLGPFPGTLSDLNDLYTAVLHY